MVILMTNMLYSISRNHGSTTGHESPSGCSCSLVDTANDLVRDHRVAFQIEPYIALSRGCLLHCPVVDEDGSSRTAGIRNRDRTVVMAGTPGCPSSAIVVILSPLRSLVSLSSPSSPHHSRPIRVRGLIFRKTLTPIFLLMSTWQRSAPLHSGITEESGPHCPL
jgi:hypothetical protein